MLVAEDGDGVVPFGQTIGGHRDHRILAGTPGIEHGGRVGGALAELKPGGHIGAVGQGDFQVGGLQSESLQTGLGAVGDKLGDVQGVQFAQHFLDPLGIGQGRYVRVHLDARVDDLPLIARWSALQFEDARAVGDGDAVEG